MRYKDDFVGWRRSVLLNFVHCVHGTATVGLIRCVGVSERERESMVSMRE